MTVIPPGVQIALTLFDIASRAVVAAREVENAIQEEGVGDHPLLEAARQRLTDETRLSSHRFQQSIDAERARREAAETEADPAEELL